MCGKWIVEMARGQIGRPVKRQLPWSPDHREWCFSSGGALLGAGMCQLWKQCVEKGRATVSLGHCCGLNVCVPPPPNSYVENLITKVIVVGGVAFGNGLGHKGKALMTGINAFIKEAPHTYHWNTHPPTSLPSHAHTTNRLQEIKRREAVTQPKRLKGQKQTQ